MKMDSKMLIDVMSLIFTIFLVVAYTTNQIRIYKSKNHYLNQEQVRDNIKNNRRYDWGTGQEDNWRHTWNPANPVRHKWFEILQIMAKCVVLFFVGRYIIRVLIAIILIIAF